MGVAVRVNVGVRVKVGVLVGDPANVLVAVGTWVFVGGKVATGITRVSVAVGIRVLVGGGPCVSASKLFAEAELNNPAAENIMASAARALSSIKRDFRMITYGLFPTLVSGAQLYPIFLLLHVGD